MDSTQGPLNVNAVNQNSAGQQQTTPTQHPKLVHNPGNHNVKPSNGLVTKLILVLTAIILVIVLVGAVTYIWHYETQKNQTVSTTAPEAGQINTKEYQSVFLTNGQVYFGKITAVTSTYIKLTDIYYLQVQQSVQPSTSSASNSTSATSSNSNAQLVKLGNELHGPEDEMQIYRPQILFWENLKPSGKVTQAINKYQSQ
jgi:hypothetical protein